MILEPSQNYKSSKHWWVYGTSVLITAIGIGGTLFFFMKSPSEKEEVTPQTETVIEESSKKGEQGLIEKENIIPGSVDENFSKAKQLKVNGDFIKAKNILEQLIKSTEPLPNIDEMKKELWDTNIKIMFSDLMVEGWTQEILVKKGNSIIGLANRNHTTAELLAESNYIKNNMIQPGQKLRVFTGQLSILVDKSDNTLILKVNDEIFKVYQVSTGALGSTPVGTFKIVNKMVNPSWFHEGKSIPFGDPQNILGTRWMGFDLKGYGIHGTWDPASIGTQASAGCVRLLNEEVEELFKIVPVGTVVTIVE